MPLVNYKNVLMGIMFVPCIYAFKRLYTTYTTLRKEFKEEELFYERHNSIVMYSRTQITGWPPEYKIKITTQNLDKFLEPYLYFINTAKHSLDLAVMTLAMNQMLDALQNATERGIKVRIIVNFMSVKSLTKEFKKLTKSGIKICYYIEKNTNLSNIMHCKYIVKDYDGKSGFLCMGSMNLTGISTLIRNFEDVIFSSNIRMVEAFHKNFEECWDMINHDNENIYNRTMLSDYGFLT